MKPLFFNGKRQKIVNHWIYHIYFEIKPSVVTSMTKLLGFFNLGKSVPNIALMDCNRNGVVLEVLRYKGFRAEAKSKYEFWVWRLGQK